MPTLRILLLAVALGAAAATAQVPTFTLVNTGLDSSMGNAGKGLFDPQVAGFSGIAFGVGKFVAVGASSNGTTINWATSADGATWTAHTQTITGGTTAQTSKVHYLNGKFVFFVGLGDSGIGSTWAYTSSDGLTWTGNKVTDGRINVEEFDASSTLTVAAAHNGNQFASADLVTWTARPVVPNAAGFDHLDLTYGAGRFFSSINGFGGTTYSSTDAVTWTSLANTAVVGGSRAEAGNGLVIFNVGNDRYKTTDGVTFTKFTPTVPTGWLAPGGPVRFTTGGFTATAIDLNTLKSGYLLSGDGQTWTLLGYYIDATAPAGQSRGYFHTDIAYGNGKFVIAGQDISQTISTKTTLPLIMTLDAAAAPTPPSIGTHPQSVSAVVGGTASFSVSVPISGVTYQWRKDGVAISGATSATLTLNSVTAASAGSYTVVVTNSAGSVTSNAASLTLVTASNIGRLVNMSIRTNAGTGDNTLIVGVGFGGAGTSGTKAVLVRGVGPTLGSYGVSGALVDPVLTAYQGSTVVGQNDDWAGGFDFNAVGAFPFNGNAPKDAAIYNAGTSVGSYSVQITGKNNGTGIALAEIYDATPSAGFAATTPRLVNVSARAQVGTGDNILIAGFVIGGSTSVRVLVRAAGPALTGFGVGGALANPKLELYNSANAKIAENDDWGATADLKNAFNSVGAFMFTPDTSKDAALVATLQPGSYTAQISGVAATTGVALVEVYELP